MVLIWTVVSVIVCSIIWFVVCTIIYRLYNNLTKSHCAVQNFYTKIICMCRTCSKCDYILFKCLRECIFSCRQQFLLQDQHQERISEENLTKL